MRNQRFVRLPVLALLLPVILGLGCGLKRDWNICAPDDKQPCLPGYVCTADLRCVMAGDGGSDALVAPDSHGPTDAAGGGLDGLVSAGTDGPGGAGSDTAGSSALPDAAVGTSPGLDGSEPDRAPAAVSPDAPVGAVPDAAPVASLPDAPLANLPDAPPVGSPPDVSIPDAPIPDAPIADARAVDAPGTCAADKDCPAESPLCLSNRCAKCAGDNDCTGRTGTPVCAASGLCVACTSGSKQCSLLQPQLCSAVGQWQNSGLPCSTLCNGGTCAACAPGAQQCNGSQPQTCNPSGTWQNTGNACSGCYTCSTATGTCVANTGASCGTASCTVDSQGNANLTPAGSCNSSGTCAPGTVGPCAGGFTCASATACKATTCSANTDCAAGYYCTGSGGTCSAKKATGLTCGAASECASNYCVDNVCCGTACSLAAAGCMGCSNATTGGPNGTCAVKNGAATHACPAVNPTACVDFQTNADNCGSCGNACSSVGLPSGASRACKYGSCDAACAAGNQLCTDTGGIRSCVASVWGFETEANSDWLGSDSASWQRSSAQHHSGSWSLQVYSTDGYMTDVDPNGYICGGNATFDARGRTLSAWFFIDAASTPAGASCNLNGDASWTRTDPPARTWFQLTGTYPSTEPQQYSFNVGCDGLPANMKYYVDDVRID